MGKYELGKVFNMADRSYLFFLSFGQSNFKHIKTLLNTEMNLLEKIYCFQCPMALIREPLAINLMHSITKQESQINHCNKRLKIIVHIKKIKPPLE